MIEIRNQIEYPTKVNKIFKNHVQCFKAEDNLKDVLNYIKDKSYTQFPVFDQNEFLGLVSDNGITFWLSEVIKEEIVDLSEVKIADVIGHDENRMNYVTIKADMSLYNVDELFSRRIRNGERGVVLLITALGKIEKPEDIIGIITPWDLPKINEIL
nr:CBS domain-containing protein [Salinicoccus sp. RF5]